MVDRGSDGLQESPRMNNSTVVDQRSSGLQQNPEVGNAQKTWEKRPKTLFTQENHRERSRKSSVDYCINEQNRNIFINVKKFSQLQHPGHQKNICRETVDKFDQYFEANLHTSTRKASKTLKFGCLIIWKVLQKIRKFKTYRTTKVHNIEEQNYEFRMTFTYLFRERGLRIR